MTYLEIYDMRFQSTDLKRVVAVACSKAANDILFEDPATENHVKRAAWAKRALTDTTAAADQALWGVCQNATIQTGYPVVSDTDVQFVVNGLVPSFLV